MRAAAAVCRVPAAAAAFRGVRPCSRQQAATVCAAAVDGGGGGGGSERQRTALVCGSSRGLGLEFCSQLLQRSDTAHVVATCRTPSAELLELQQRHAGRLTVLPQVDTLDEASLAAAAARVGSELSHLDLLINATGILHNQATGLAPETALARVTLAALQENFHVNAAGHILMLKHMAPLLAAAAKANGATAERPAVAASLSARVGSIGDNHLGGWMSYRASKSALNQLYRCAAIEFERKKQPIAALVLHPGTVDTDLSKPFQKNVAPEKLFSRERAVQQLLGIIDGASMAQAGRFFDWAGKEVEW